MKIVIIENDENWSKRTMRNIETVLSSNKVEGKILLFKEYNENLKRLIYDNNKKIYVLDIELGDSSGYDIAKEIRDEAHDWESVIIISSIYNQKENIISDRLSVLTYISKLSRFDNNMKESVKLAISIITKNNFLEFKESGINYKIPINDVIYIRKEKYSKYCIIKTVDNFFRVRDSLMNLKEASKLTQIRKDLLINKKYITNKKDVQRLVRE